jgi:hypothetical protein
MTQMRTASVALERFMRSREFRRGVAEIRAGQAPDFDTTSQPLMYEAGRQFGAVAPPTMLIVVNGKLNPKATALFQTISGTFR